MSLDSEASKYRMFWGNPPPMLAEFPVPLPLVDNAPESSYSFCFTAGKYPVSPSMFGGDPNIVGGYSCYPSYLTNLSGAFKDSERLSSLAQQLSGANEGTCSIDFNASNGSSIYNGDKFQASALQCLACIKS